MSSRFLLLLISCIVSLFSQSQSPASLERLQCEYLVNPLGIDAGHPRLSWQLMDARQGARQTAYELCVGTDSLRVEEGKGDTWLTGKLNSAEQLVRFNGKDLDAFTRYFWRVRIWDKDGKQSGWSPVSFFETGMKDRANWKGAWISDGRSIHEKAAPYFRKAFNTGKQIKTARAYISAAGLFELYINGEKIGDHRLDPMYTRFDRRLLYLTHDVTAALQQGENVAAVVLGNGWYNHQSTAVWFFHEAPWRARPAFCMDIRIVYEDGSVETISTGKNWKTATGPIIFNSIYTAEHHDARIQQTGWSSPGFDDSKWSNSTLRSAPAPLLVSQAMQPVRNTELIPVKSFKKFSDTCYVFDLGRNIAGVSRLKIYGERGTRVRLRHSERIYPNGHTDMSNIDVHYRPTDNTDPFQTDIFILAGNGEEVFMPVFNYKGFRYVEVTSNKPLQLTAESLTGHFMHSDVPVHGGISSSNPIVNKIWEATNNSYLSNLFGYPTDCPQREKNGWTGDAHIASETGLYNFDAITVYEKWLADHRDEQQPNGVLPSIIPTGGWGYEWGNGPDWTSTIAIIPWNIYLFYGDTTLLAASYAHIKRYVDHITEISPTGLTTWGLGDWVPVKSKTPVEFTSSAYYYTDVKILSDAAKLLGKTDDHLHYQALAESIRMAFNAKYYDPATGSYGSGLQTELSVPLQWGLVPDSLKTKVAANLARRVMADSNHIDVGLLGTKAILNALSENGYANLAYQLAAQETLPSWGWWIKNGATTLYENWPIDAQSDISQNHIMFGEIGAWFFKGLGGIKPDPEHPGFRNILLAPNFAEGLDQFAASHQSPYGLIRSAWEKKKKTISYSVTIPPGATASLSLPAIRGKQLYKDGLRVKPGGASFAEKLESGTYTFIYR